MATGTTQFILNGSGDESFSYYLTVPKRAARGAPVRSLKEAVGRIRTALAGFDFDATLAAVDVTLGQVDR